MVLKMVITDQAAMEAAMAHDLGVGIVKSLFEDNKTAERRPAQHEAGADNLTQAINVNNPTAKWHQFRSTDNMPDAQAEELGEIDHGQTHRKNPKAKGKYLLSLFPKPGRQYSPNAGPASRRYTSSDQMAMARELNDGFKNSGGKFRQYSGKGIGPSQLPLKLPGPNIRKPPGARASEMKAPATGSGRSKHATLVSSGGDQSTHASKSPTTSAFPLEVSLAQSSMGESKHASESGTMIKSSSTLGLAVSMDAATVHKEPKTPNLLSGPETSPSSKLGPLPSLSSMPQAGLDYDSDDSQGQWSPEYANKVREWMDKPVFLNVEAVKRRLIALASDAGNNEDLVAVAPYLWQMLLDLPKPKPTNSGF